MRTPDGRILPGRDGLLLALLTALSMMMSGYQFGVSDQLLFLPAVSSWLSPTGYHPNDLLVQHIWATHPTMFWHLLAPLLRVVAIPQLLFLLYVVSHFAFLAAVFAVAHRLVGSRAAAFIAVVLLLSPKPVGGTMIDTHPVYTVSRTVAMPLALWALYGLLTRRYRLASVLAFIAFDIHPLSALPVVLLVLSSCLLDRPIPTRARVSSTALLLGGILPLLVWRWAVGGPGDWAASAEWLAILRRRVPYTFVTTWSWEQWESWILCGLAFLTARPFIAPSSSDGVVRRLWLVLGVLAVIAVSGTVLLFVPLIGQLQLLRGGQLGMIIAAIYFAGYLRHLYARSTAEQWLAVGLLYAFFALLPALFYPCLLVGLATQLVSQGDQGRLRSACLAAMTLVAWALHQRFSSAVARQAPGIPVVAVLGAVSILYHAIKPSLARPTRLVGFGLVLVLGVLTVWYDEDVRRVVRSPQRALLERIAWPWSRAQPSDWTDVQRWAKAHTLPQSLFITPPYREGFRLSSGRSPVVEYKDGALGMFSARVATAWWQRLQSLRGWPLAESRRRYAAFTATEFRRIAATAGATYLVAERPSALPFQTLYDNATFVVYAIQ